MSLKLIIDHRFAAMLVVGSLLLTNPNPETLAPVLAALIDVAFRR